MTDAVEGRSRQTTSEAGARLHALEGVAQALGADGIGQDATALAERLAQGRFFVACVGQFKRGKSTLLNALLGQAVLPTGVTPITTAVTVLRHGPSCTAQVRFADGRREIVAPERLDEFVSESRNPENSKGVVAVEVSVPSGLLQSGMCLVDTPGLGSVFAVNSTTTRAFIPQIDAALVVVGTDPPISGEELDLVEQVARRVDHVLVALNKSDRVSDTESLEAAAFTKRVIARRLGEDVGEVYRVSALERLAGHETRDWPRLEAALEALAGQSASVVEASAARGVSRIAAGLLREIDEQTQALERPLEDSERRLTSLRQAITEADYALRELSARMQVERVALADRFRNLRATFLASDGRIARRELEDAVQAAAFHRGPSMRQVAFEMAHDIAKRRVTAWARETEPRAEQLYAETVARFVSLANEFVARLAPDSSAGVLSSEEFVVERGFCQDAHFFFTSILTLAAPGFWTWVLDWARPRTVLLRSSVRQAEQYLDRLMTTNSARMANDLGERVAESQRRLEREIRGRLSRLVASAERALDRARTQHAAGAEAVRAELTRLARLRTDVEEAQRRA